MKNYEHLKDQYGLTLRNTLLEFYNKLRELEDVSGPSYDKYDPKTTNQKIEAIIETTIQQINGREYEYGAIQDHRSSGV